MTQLILLRVFLFINCLNSLNFNGKLRLLYLLIFFKLIKSFLRYLIRNLFILFASKLADASHSKQDSDSYLIELIFDLLAIISTFGTTGTVSFDPINKISEIAYRYKIWHHIDAAYAGSVLFLEEYQKLIGETAI